MYLTKAVASVPSTALESIAPTFFWQPSRVFSQLNPARFTVGTVESTCSEQVFLQPKHRISEMTPDYGLSWKLLILLRTNDLGNKLNSSTRGAWDKERKYIVLVASYETFSESGHATTFSGHRRQTCGS